MELGERIATWRESKGLTPRELADAIGVTPPAIYQWEDGTTTPSLAHLERLVEVLGVTMERFYGRTPKIKTKDKAAS